VSDDLPEPWWGDESPVGVGRRRGARAAPAGDHAPDWPADDLGVASGRDHDPGLAPGGDYGPRPAPSRDRDRGGDYDLGAPPVGDYDLGASRGGEYDLGGAPGRDYDPGPIPGGDYDPGPIPGADYDIGAAGGPEYVPGAVGPGGDRDAGLGFGADVGRGPGAEGLPGADPDGDGPKRSSAQFFVPAPEDLPPFEEVVGPPRGRRGSGRPAEPVSLDGIPDAPPLPFASGSLPGPDVPEPPDPVAASPREPSPAPARPRRQPIDRRRLATVYDVDGPRVRLGVAWFAGALVAVAISPFTAALVYAAAAGLAARQVARAWGSVSWQADLAAGLAAVPVLAALIGFPAVVATLVLGIVVAVGAAASPDGARMPGPGGRAAAAGILMLSMVAAVGGASFVLVRAESVLAAGVLLIIASAYEMGDYIVGSGSTNPVEGPLAGITTATLVALPLALVLVEPYNDAGVGLLVFTAVACPLGQVLASAALPGAGAPAPALRRIDTLLVLALVWAAASGAF
jgi:hypothetical protein